MRGERRRARGLLRAVVDDPYRKLMAIGLAVLMWFIVNNRIEATDSRRLPLVVAGELVDRSTNQLAVVLGNDHVTSRSFWNGTQQIDDVGITVTGPRFAVDTIREQWLNLVVVHKVQTALGGAEQPDAESFEFTVADFRRDPLLRDVEITMDPPRVRLEYKIEDNYTVALPPLDPRLIEIAIDPSLESRALRQTVSYYPKTMRVIGRGSELARLKDRPAPLFRASLVPAGVRGNKVSAKIQLIGDLDVHIESETTVEMDLQPQTRKFTLDIPFFVDDLSLPPDQRGRYEPESVSQSVVLNVSGGVLVTLTGYESGNPGALAAFGRANFRLLLSLEPPEQGGSLADTITGVRAFLIPTGKLLLPSTDRNEFSLAEVVTVNLRRKQ